MAEKLGYSVDIVKDGLAALEATEHREYAAVLMDCHMPVMDGFAATKAIRARGGKDQVLPIIAMTAAASDQDRERCLATGMNDYLSKPVDMAELETTLSRWTSNHWNDMAEPPPVAADEQLETARRDQGSIDQDRLDVLRSLGILDATAEAFLRETAKSMEDLRRASQDGGYGLQKAAHKLRGSAGNIGAARAARLCAELEEHGRQGTRPGLGLLDALETELTHVEEALHDVLAAQ
jgi:CheY-like chemotaxis protein